MPPSAARSSSSAARLTSKNGNSRQEHKETGLMQSYILGHSNRELRRLMLQSDNLRPITTRLLREIGFAQGMHVVDLGCGAGDVAMLAAEMVGPTGGVIGIDRNAAAIATARKRPCAAGHDNIEFVEGDASEMIGSGNSDLAIGRYVLVHQSDPVALFRAVGGVAAPVFGHSGGRRPRLASLRMGSGNLPHCCQEPRKSALPGAARSISIGLRNTCANR
jgi:2-polyprenyl-3-methyl-5-hydroxy-6-metoxy-1,4-benzoquinol methylase